MSVVNAANSAIVILVPEAEACVGGFRARHDPSAVAGMPAHVTLLYPFIAPAMLDEEQRDALKVCVAGFRPFAFSLSEVCRFPSHLLYLAPEPANAFRELTMAIWKAFPDYPPYGGRHPDIVPHLSVAQAASDDEINRISQAFAPQFERQRPIRAVAQQVLLMDNAGGRWRTRQDFLLRG